ncbi:MAG: molybdopterin oxidoreductase family protein, partial [Solirubrobacteraceae bacterium]
MATGSATHSPALGVRRTATHCPYCSLQCGMEIAPGDDGRPKITPLDFPSNRGGLCRKGHTAASLLGHPERLRTPLVRDAAGELVPASWDDALDRIAARIAACQAEHGREAVGVFGGGGLTNEKAYQLGKFARVALRTPSIDYNGRFCMSSAATAANQALGIDRGLPFPLSDIGDAGAVLLAGSNIAETMPPAVSRLDDLVGGGGALIVADPRATQTARRATVHLQLTPGTDLALANGLLHIAIREGHVDEAYVDERTHGFEWVRERLGAYWPDRVERITGVPVERLRRAVALLGEAESAMVLTGRGPEQQHQGTDTVLAFINLALALGLPGRPRSGWGCLTGQGNGQGGREHGQKADQLPGYRSITDPEARAHVAGVWGVDPSDLPGEGLSAWEMLEAMGAPGGVRALLVMGSNPVVSAPNAGLLEERLRALDLLVVADVFLSDTAKLADVVLPTTQWAEETGTMTNVEGRVVLRRAAMAPEEGVRS